MGDEALLWHLRMLLDGLDLAWDVESVAWVHRLEQLILVLLSWVVEVGWYCYFER